VRAVVIRFAGLYGPGRVIGGAALRAGKPIESDPEGPLNLIHRDDAAGVAAAAIEHPDPAPIYCACDNRPILRREYYETAARHLDAPTPTFAPPGGESSRRRISNRAMVRDLLRELVHPDITTGLPASIAEEERSRIERDRSQA
jgi:nucleoside-diphosphate-sugar epimerase